VWRRSALQGIEGNVSLTALSRWALNRPLLAGASAETELPNDPALPGLVAIRAAGLASALPELELKGCPFDFALRVSPSRPKQPIPRRRRNCTLPSPPPD